MQRLEIKLTKAERKRSRQLIQEYGKAGRAQKAKRFRALLAFADGLSLRDACQTADAPLSSVQRWLAEFLRSGGTVESFEPQSPPGRPPALTDEDLVDLAAVVAEGPERAGYDTGVWTGALVADLVSRDYGVHY